MGSRRDGAPSPPPPPPPPPASPPPDGEFLPSETTIGKYIARFRYEKPRPRDARVPLNKDDFWWTKSPRFQRSQLGFSASLGSSRLSGTHIVDEIERTGGLLDEEAAIDRDDEETKQSEPPTTALDDQSSAKSSPDHRRIDEDKDREGGGRPLYRSLDILELQVRQELGELVNPAPSPASSWSSMGWEHERNIAGGVKGAGGSVEDPEAVIERVRRRLGWRSPSFGDASPSPPVLSPPPPLSTADLCAATSPARSPSSVSSPGGKASDGEGSPGSWRLRFDTISPAMSSQPSFGSRTGGYVHHSLHSPDEPRSPLSATQKRSSRSGSDGVHSISDMPDPLSISLDDTGIDSPATNRGKMAPTPPKSPAENTGSAISQRSLQSSALNTPDVRTQLGSSGSFADLYLELDSQIIDTPVNEGQSFRSQRSHDFGMTSESVEDPEEEAPRTNSPLQTLTEVTSQTKSPRAFVAVESQRSPAPKASPRLGHPPLPPPRPPTSVTPPRSTPRLSPVVDYTAQNTATEVLNGLVGLVVQSWGEERSLSGESEEEAQPATSISTIPSPPSASGEADSAEGLSAQAEPDIPADDEDGEAVQLSSSVNESIESISDPTIAVENVVQDTEGDFADADEHDEMVLLLVKRIAVFKAALERLEQEESHELYHSPR